MSNEALFILGGPGSGKDFVINNILNRFNIVEVQIDQLLGGAANRLIESGANLMVNSNADMTKIELVKRMLEGYSFSHTIVSVTNKISRERNESREKPMREAARIRKWLDAENISVQLENVFVFKNSINLSEAATTDLGVFQNQIASYLGFLLENGLEMTVEKTVETIKPAVLQSKPLGKKKRIVPPNNMNMRIDGSGGYSLGGLTIGEESKVARFSESAAWKNKRNPK
jgi:hypothetical protein